MGFQARKTRHPFHVTHFKGDRIRILRQSFGYSMQEVADAVQIPCHRMQMLEAGTQVYPEMEVVVRLAYTFDTPVESFYTFDKMLLEKQITRLKRRRLGERIKKPGPKPKQQKQLGG